MSSGGHSFHTGDWLKVAAAVAATVATAGMAAPAMAGAAGAEAAGAGAGLLGGTAAADTAAAGLGGGTAALFGPTAGGSALAAEGAAIPSITSAGAAGAGAGMGGGTASLFGGQGLLAGSSPEMFTAGLGAGAGGASAPTFMDTINSGLSNMLPGGNQTLSSIKSGLSRVAKAQQAIKSSGLLQPPQQVNGGAGGVPPSAAFGQRASPVNLSQFMNQPNSMMMGQGQQQLPPQLAMLPPNDPRVLAYLQQMGGMNG